MPSERKPKASAQGVNVAAHIHLAASELFRAGVTGRSDKSPVSQIPFPKALRRHFSETKVDYFYFELRARLLTASQHDITRFQIAVNQPLTGRSNEGARHLLPNLEHLPDLKRSLPPNAGFQRFAFHQFHRVIATVQLWHRAKLVNRSNIRVAQGTCRPRLA
jgi:hypothetical protein